MTNSTSAADQPGTTRAVYAGAAALLLTALATTVIGCAGGGPPIPVHEPGRPAPEAYVTTVTGPDGRAAPLVRVEVPYRSLVFRRLGDGYVADLRVQVTAWREDRQVGGGVGSGQAVASSYAATRARERLAVDVPLVIRGEDEVSLTVESLVPRTERRWRQSLALSPRAAAVIPLAIEDVTIVPATMFDGASLVTSADDSVTLGVRLRAAGEATWPAGGVRLTVALSGGGREEPDRYARSIPPLRAAADTIATLAWPASSLPFGRTVLDLGLEVRDGDRVDRLPYGPRRELLVLRVPFTDDRAWRQHVGWLDGLLPAADLDSLRRSDPEARDAAWQAAWTRIAAADGEEPQLAMTAHLRRVAEADERFGQFGRGALSDRGRAYIRYGEPERIEQTLDDLSRTGVWEIWVYPTRGLRLIFFDANGINDFRLVEVRQD